MILNSADITKRYRFTEFSIKMVLLFCIVEPVPRENEPVSGNKADLIKKPK